MSDATESLSKSAVLRSLNFGARVAEDERESLSDYFVETDQWAQVVDGRVDVVFGTKGSGKSAIYTSLMNRVDRFLEDGVVLITAEKPRGNTVFRNLADSPPKNEVEFVALWKLYILSLVGSVIADRDLGGSKANKVKEALYLEGLLEAEDAPLKTRFTAVLEWLSKAFARLSPEGEMGLDPMTGSPNSISFKISVNEPSRYERSEGFRSLDDLLQVADAALEENGLQVWILFDRLDVAFAEDAALESSGIRSLFMAYLDGLELDNIKLKIFLRTDIWNTVTQHGFREASHITRQLRLEWQNPSLLNLVTQRAISSREVVEYYGTSRRSVLERAENQRQFFRSMVPEKVDVGKNPETFEWILGRVQDGTRKPAPREVIHLLNETRDAQVRMLERGESLPSGKELLSRAAFREALSPVSATRLQQTLFAENADVKEWVKALEGGKTEYTISSLSEIWGVGALRAAEIAQRLVEVGFMEERGDRAAPTYWIPFLYRPALNLKQGAATSDERGAGPTSL